MVARSMVSGAPKLDMVAALAADLERPGGGDDAALAVAQLARQIVVEPVAAALGLQRQGEAAVAVDVDGLERVHLDRDGERHGGPWSVVGRRRSASSRPKAARPPSAGAAVWQPGPGLTRRQPGRFNRRRSARRIAMAYDPSNVFARILRGEIPCRKVYEDEWALAFHDINPLAPVHVLVIPKGAYVSMADFTASASDAEIAGFLRAVGTVGRQLGVEEGGYRVLANTVPPPTRRCRTCTSTCSPAPRSGRC